jgi:beta-barrel assembly-enhancing protease
MLRRVGGPARRTGGRGGGGRILIAIVMALFAIGSYYFGTSLVENPVTGEVQRVNMTTEDEIMMGLQAAPEMAQQFGGLHPDENLQNLMAEIGQTIVTRSAAGQTDYQFSFHLLADAQTVNAFALPGGPIFITAALFERLQTEGQLAGVLGHEIGHVVARHSAERIAQSQLVEGLTGAAVIAAYDPENPTSAQRAQMAAVVGQLITMRYGREDELESDRLGVRFMADAGYDPRSLIGVMQVLQEAGGGGQPEFFSTHPNPENRIERIQEAIAAEFPDGVPDGLIE